MLTFRSIPAPTVESGFPAFWHPAGLFAAVVLDDRAFGIVGLLPMSPSVGWLSYCALPADRQWLTKHRVEQILRWPQTVYNMHTVFIWTMHMHLARILQKLGHPCAWSGADSTLFVVETS